MNCRTSTPRDSFTLCYASYLPPEYVLRTMKYRNPQPAAFDPCEILSNLCMRPSTEKILARDPPPPPQGRREWREENGTELLLCLAT